MIFILAFLILMTFGFFLQKNINETRKQDVSMVEKLTLSFALGTGGTTFLMYGLAMAGNFLSLFTLLLVILPLTCFLFFKTGKWRKKKVERQQGFLDRYLREPPSVRLLLLAVSCFVVWKLVFVFHQAGIQPFHISDEVYNWAFLGKIIFIRGGIKAEDLLMANHPDYPLLIPLLEVWFQLFEGEWSESGGRLIFPFYYAFLGLLFIFQLKKFVPQRTAALFLFFLFSMPLLTYHGTIEPRISPEPSFLDSGLILFLLCRPSFGVLFFRRFFLSHSLG